MCRLFGLISANPETAYEPLVTSSHSLLRQSHVDRKRLQGDGWGVGWFDENSKLRVIKSPRPIYKEAARLRKTARRVRGRAIVAHIRWASNPLKLPKSELIGPTHSQPFIHGRWLFAHNGTLYIPEEVKRALGRDWARHIQGKNDSEVLFYWLMKNLTPALARAERSGSDRPITQAVRRAIRGIDKIWSRCRKRHPIYQFGYHGLNWVLTDGKILVGCCYVNPKGWDKGQALCSRAPYFQLRLQVAPDRVLVSSEPLDPSSSWSTVRHGEVLVARREHERVTLHREKVL